MQGILFEELERILIGQDKEKYFQIGSQLPPLEKAMLVKFLEDNIDVFTWSIYDIPRIDPEFICHRLNVNSDVVPQLQPPWCSSKEHVEAIRIEVKKLKQAGAIKEIFYKEWLANIVVVKKKNRNGVCLWISQI